MAKKLISVLGIGDYDECIYAFKNKESKTPFIQQAIVDIMCDSWNKNDQIVIALTKGAKKKNWDKLKVELGKIKDKLDLIELDIPDGSNEEELWELFNNIYGCIEENDEVIVDITHSFRSIPMFMIIVLNYAKVMKNIKVNGIYYGAFLNPIGEKDNLKIAPIFDLTSFNELLEITQGIDTFLNTGNSKKLAETTKEINSNNIKNNNKSFIPVNETVQALDNLTKSINTCRGNCKVKKDKRKSISVAYKNFKHKLQRVKESTVGQVKMFRPLFEKVERDTSIFDDDGGVPIGLATVKWCINNNLIQQGYTALDETIQSYICDKYGLDMWNLKHRNEIARVALRSVSIKSRGETNESHECQKINEIISTELKEVFEIADKISQKRNDINHFGIRENPGDNDKLIRDLKECYQQISKLIQEEDYSV